MRAARSAPTALLLRLGTRLRRVPGAIWPTDLLLATRAWWGAYWLRFNVDVPARYFGQMLQTTPLAALGTAAGLALQQVPRQSRRHVGVAKMTASHRAIRPRPHAPSGITPIAHQDAG